MLIEPLGSEDASMPVSLGMGDASSDGAQGLVLEAGIAIVASVVANDSEDEMDEDDEIQGLVERLEAWEEQLC